MDVLQDMARTRNSSTGESSSSTGEWYGLEWFQERRGNRSMKRSRRKSIRNKCRDNIIILLD
jgi:hypothetical protein